MVAYDGGNHENAGNSSYLTHSLTVVRDGPNAAGRGWAWPGRGAIERIERRCFGSARRLGRRGGGSPECTAGGPGSSADRSAIARGAAIRLLEYDPNRRQRGSSFERTRVPALSD